MDFTRADVAHLLRRAGFGGTTAEIDALMELDSWAEVVDRVLDTTANPADVIPEAVEDRDDQWYVPWVSSVQYWMDRMATSPTPIVEKMTLFWHGFFVSSVEKMVTRVMFKQIKTYRALALGDLHELAQEMAKDPAMLLYLDNWTNKVGNPNENFARELMELFLLGQGHYTEADVVDMARAWTGHSFDTEGETYIYYPGRHDNGQKTIWGMTRNWDGPDTITEMVRGSKQQACARFVATKLWAFLAGPAPAPAVIDDLAAAFVTADMDIKELVRAIFLRPEFRTPAVRTGLLRSPVEWMVATMRALGLPANVARPEWFVERAGQYLYAPPNVGGWRANEGWIATSTTWGRGSFASHIQWMARDRGVFAGAGSMTPAAAAQMAFDRFGVAEPSPATRAAVEAYVRGEQTAHRGWAVQPGLVVLMMMSPDFQAA